MTKPAGRTLWPTFPAPTSGRKALAVHTPWGFTPKRLLVLIAALVAAAAVAVGAAWLTGPHTGSARQATVSTVSQTTSCQRAMAGEYAAALQHGTPGAEPAACQGLPAAELRQLAGQVLGGAVSDNAASCKAAMKNTPYAVVLAAGDTGTAPAACAGVPMQAQREDARQDVLGQ